jgi:hypothetical protein
MWTLLITLSWAAPGSTQPEGTAPAPTECGGPVSVEALVASISDATGAFANLDLDGFGARTGMVWDQLPCLSEALTPLDVADVYKLRALDALLAQDDERVRDSLRSARAAAPDYRLPASIAPKGHPLKIAFDEVGDDMSPREDLPVPSEARVLVDGQAVLTRPTDRAAIVQLVTIDGAVAWTQMVEEGAAVPAYEALSDDFRDDYLKSSAKVIRVRSRRPIELVVASSVAVIGASAMYGLSRSSRATFFDPETPYEDLAGLRARTNGLQTAAVLTGAAGLGLGATAVVSW